MELIVWSRRILLAIIATGLASAFSCIILIIADKIFKRINPYLHLWMCKAAVVLCVLPVLTPFIYLSRLQLSHGVWVSRGNIFGGVSLRLLPAHIIVIFITIIIVSLYVVHHNTLAAEFRSALKGNVPVEDSNWLKLLEEYKQKYSIHNVEIFQNDMLNTPVSVGIRNYKIIIPYSSFSVKHMHMILEHEFYHIRHHDILWKKLGFVATCIHVLNIFTHRIFNELVFHEEVVCDLYASTNNPNYTQLEYIKFLGELEDDNVDESSASSFGGRKNFIERRIRYIMKYKVLKKPSKIITALAMAAFMLVSLAPSYVFAAEAVDLEIKLNDKYAVMNEEQNVPFENYLEEKHGYASDDPSVTEKYVYEDGIMPFGGAYNIDITVAPNDRMLYSRIWLVYGQTVTISVTPDKDNVPYRIGIRSDVDGYMTYVDGTGDMIHTFTIDVDDYYNVFIENLDDNEHVKVTGYARWRP